MARSLEDDTLANLEEVVRLLQETHGSPRHGNKDDPLDELVYIILSNRTRQEAAHAVNPPGSRLIGKPWASSW